jgi:hypothetical protein
MFGLRLATKQVCVPSRLVVWRAFFCTKLYRQRDIAPADCGEASGMSIFPNWVLLKLAPTTQARAAQNSRPRVCACTFSKGAVAFFSAFCACACYCRVVARTCTCFCGVLPLHIPVPIGCEHFVVVGLTRIGADTMTLRGYKSRKSTRLGPE